MQALIPRLVKLTAVLAIVASVFGPGTPLPTLKVHAQSIEPTAGDTDPAIAKTVQQANRDLPAATASANASANTGSGGTDLQCSTSNIALCISGFVYWITVGIGSWVANITAYVFDYAVMLSLQSSAYALDFIAIGWGIVRDVANMSFLFILVYIAFKIMFQAETAGTTRMLVWVVIIALLVNFSFVMTRFVIDAGNIVALQFYNSIASGSPYINGETKPTNGGIPVKDITSSIMTALNPQDIIGNGGQFKNFIANQNNSQMYYLIVSSVIYLLTGVCLFMIAAIFIFSAVRFVTRVIGLAGLIIIAPAAFIAAIFRGKEGGSKWFNTWLGYLLEFTFYPAIFLFLFYIEVRFMQEMGNAKLFNSIFNAAGTGGQSWTLIAQASANVAVRLSYIIASMYLVLRASQWSSEAFNKVGTKWAENGLLRLGRGSLKLGGAGAARVGGLAYQQMIGRGAAATNTALERRGVGSSWLGYRARQGIQALSGAKIGNTRSFNQFKDAREKELTERAKIHERADRRGAVQDLYESAANEKTSAQQTVTTQKAQGQAAVNSLYRAAQREANQPNDITAGPSVAIPTGTRRLPGGAQINQVQGGPTGLPASTPFNVSAQRALDEIKQKTQRTAQAGTVAATLVTTPPTMSQSTSARPPIAEPQKVSADTGALRDEMRGLGQSVREAVAAVKNGTTMAPKVVISAPNQVKVSSSHTDIDYEKLKGAVKNAVRKEFEHFEPTAPHEPTPPTPAAPAAAKPAPQAHNDDYPYSQAAE
jgi:hypothetical protein